MGDSVSWGLGWVRGERRGKLKGNRVSVIEGKRI